MAPVRTLTFYAALIALAALVSACGPNRIQQRERPPRWPDYTFPDMPMEEERTAHIGSLVPVRWESGPGVGDLVVVRVQEYADANRGAGTELTRDSEWSAGIEALFSLLSAKTGKAAMSHGFRGGGTTKRSERLEATIPAYVMKKAPNGLLFLEGKRVVLVNDEEHHFYISGVVRGRDIDLDTNSVLSSQIADAQIEFTGYGVITRKQNPGWLHQALDYITP